MTHAIFHHTRFRALHTGTEEQPTAQYPTPVTPVPLQGYQQMGAYYRSILAVMQEQDRIAQQDTILMPAFRIEAVTQYAAPEQPTEDTALTMQSTDYHGIPQAMRPLNALRLVSQAVADFHGRVGRLPKTITLSPLRRLEYVAITGKWEYSQLEEEGAVSIQIESLQGLNPDRVHCEG